MWRAFVECRFDPREFLDWLRDKGFRVGPLDEENGRVPSPQVLREGLRTGDLAPFWFCNLWARRP